MAQVALVPTLADPFFEIEYLNQFSEHRLQRKEEKEIQVLAFNRFLNNRFGEWLKTLLDLRPFDFESKRLMKLHMVPNDPIPRPLAPMPRYNWIPSYPLPYIGMGKWDHTVKRPVST